MAYTMVQGVFQVFRRRLTLSESVIFLSAFNAGMRALYTADWDPEEKLLPFGTMENMNKEVLLLRPDHNYSPENAIQITARAVWKNVDKYKFEEVLKRLPLGAVEFWRIEKCRPNNTTA